MKAEGSIITYILMIAVIILFVGALIPGLTTFYDGNQPAVPVVNETTVVWAGDNVSLTINDYPVLAASETIYNCTQPETFLASTDYTLDDDTGNLTLILRGDSEINTSCTLLISYTSRAVAGYTNYTGTVRTIGGIVPIMLIVVLGLVIYAGATRRK